MMIRVKWGIATALTLAVVALGIGLGYPRAEAQIGGANNNPYGGDGAYWNSNSGGLQQVRIPPSGTWAEVINATPKWIVVQNQAGQQFPIAADRIRQFLVRWPSSTDQLNQNSLVEVIGPDAGSNVIIADHLDIYEADAQRLVMPTFQNLLGYNRTVSAFDIDQQQTYAVVYWMTPEEYAIPSRMHVVGHPTVSAPLVQVQIPGNNVVTIQPSTNGMSVTQVTLGNNSYAKPGDLVYVILENATPRSLDVNTLVLYKKEPLRRFQP